MSFKARINYYRAHFFRSITRDIGRNALKSQQYNVKREDIRMILVCRPNHRLGNLLLITPLLQHLEEIFPNARIDLFVKGGISPQLFKEYKSVRKMIQLPKRPFKKVFSYVGGWLKLKATRYDLVINTVHHSSSGRLCTQFANGKIKFFGDLELDSTRHYEHAAHIAAYPVYSFFESLESINIKVPFTGLKPLDIRLTDQEIKRGQDLLHQLVKNDKKTICLYTFATGAKCYDSNWWQPVYEKLKSTFPEYNLIEVLPVENVSQIGFAATHFYSKDLREIASLIRACELFVGADSGMMHLASAARATTIGLFQITDPNVYGPYDNFSSSIKTPHELLDADTVVERVAITLEKKKHALA